MPYTTNVAATTITAAWGNANVRDQVVTPFASTAARDSAITVPVEGMYCITTDADYQWYYSGSKWLRQEFKVVRTSEVTFTSNTTLADDPTLQFPVDVTSTYWFKFSINWAATTTPQYKHGLTWPSGTRADYSIQSLTAAGAVYIASLANPASGTTTTGASTGAGATGNTVFEGMVVTGANAGNVVFQAAQQNSSVTPVQTVRGSYVSFQQLA